MLMLIKNKSLFNSIVILYIGTLFIYLTKKEPSVIIKHL
jgi:hypothetical protein